MSQQVDEDWDEFEYHWNYIIISCKRVSCIRRSSDSRSPQHKICLLSKLTHSTITSWSMLVHLHPRNSINSNVNSSSPCTNFKPSLTTNSRLQCTSISFNCNSISLKRWRYYLTLSPTLLNIHRPIRKGWGWVWVSSCSLIKEVELVRMAPNWEDKYCRYASPF